MKNIILPIIACKKHLVTPSGYQTFNIDCNDYNESNYNHLHSMNMLDWFVLSVIKDKEGIDHNNLSTDDIEEVGVIIQLCDHIEDNKNKKICSYYGHNACICDILLDNNNFYGSVKEISQKHVICEKKVESYKKKLWSVMLKSGVPQWSIDNIENHSNITTFDVLLNNVMEKYGFDFFDKKDVMSFLKESNVEKKYKIMTSAFSRVNVVDNNKSFVCNHIPYSNEDKKRKENDKFEVKKRANIIQFCKEKIPSVQNLNDDTCYIVDF